MYVREATPTDIHWQVFGEQRVGLFQRPRKIMVFLNPKASNK